MNFVIKEITIQIDDEDYNKINSYFWQVEYRSIKKDYRIKAIVNGKRVYLHRLIMNAPDNLVVDHINHDTLDNRKCNLRVCTASQNCMNRKSRMSHGFKGVVYRKDRGTYYAIIIVNGKQIRSGAFKSIEDAAKEYDRLAILHFGNFAYLNFRR